MEVPTGEEVIEAEEGEEIIIPIGHVINVETLVIWGVIVLTASMDTGEPPLHPGNYFL